MREITILSGKGGTGKTSITAALASVAENTVFCDNDVDAADLHLLLHPEIKETYTFHGAWIASIDPHTCTDCDLCINHCRFDAIHRTGGGKYYINPLQCEGCRLCERLCPAEAITSHRNSNNQWFVSNTRFGQLVHARMAPGEENSGKLVTEIRKRALGIAREKEASFILNDGPPGIGCATISSLSGTDQVLLVIEPSCSGLHDLKRLVALIERFSIPASAIINKYDLNDEVCLEIESFLQGKNIPLLAKIPFDKAMVEAMVEGKTIVEYLPGSEQALQIKSIWNQLQ